MSRAATELIERLRQATAAVERDLGQDPAGALLLREQTLQDLAELNRTALTESDLELLRAQSVAGAALLERARARRHQLLREIQEAAATRCFAAALTAPAGRAIVDVQL